MAKSVSDLAAELNAALVGIDRDGKRIVTLADGSPEWMTDCCRAAHDNASMLPDDWRYSFIEDAANAIENDDRDSFPDLDSLYPYTADRLRWLSSRSDRMGYCDEAADDQGFSTGRIEELIVAGMARELQEVLDSVLASLEELAEELADAKVAM